MTIERTQNKKLKELPKAKGYRNPKNELTIVKNSFNHVSLYTITEPY